MRRVLGRARETGSPANFFNFSSHFGPEANPFGVRAEPGDACSSFVRETGKKKNVPAIENTCTARRKRRPYGQEPGTFHHSTAFGSRF